MTTVPALTDEAALAQYVATGGQTDFNFSYMIFATADIEVYVNGVLKTETTHYTVKKSNGTSISASDLPLDGGKVVFVSGLTADDEVSLNRNIAIARLTGYSVAGAFRADVVNAEFTKALAISQQLRRDIERSVRLAAFDAEGGSLIIPTSRASKLLGFDADGDMALFGGVTEQIVPVSTFMATVLDDITAGAARTTLGVAIGSNVQAWDANLEALAGLTGAADKIPYFTGVGAMALSDRGYQLIKTTYFSSSGTWTKDSKTRSAAVHVWGGGGGGGGGVTNDPLGGTGGSGGGYSYKLITSGLGSTETVTIGAAGSGGSTNANGTGGGTSSFGSHCSATGGGGGIKSSNGAAGAAGSGSGGDLNLIGGQGDFGVSGVTSSNTDGFGGGGGCSPFMAGRTYSTGAGNAGQNYGCGGGGGRSSGSPSAGGNGSPGLIIVHEYA